MSPAEGLAALAAAGSSAGSRASDCRRRVEDLQGESLVIGAADVVRAQARLAHARVRAASAQRRLAEMQRYQQEQQMRRLQAASAAGSSLGHSDDAGPATPLRRKTFDWIRTGRVGLKPLWLAFISLGGESGLLEFDAFLHGAWEMSERDTLVLQQVCWEYETFGTT